MSRAALVRVAVVVLIAVAGCSAGSPSARSSPRADACAPVRGPLPPRSTPVRKVLVIVEENHTLSQVRTGMPCLMSQAESFAYATQYRAVAHPSLPNYLAITGGSTFGVTDDAGPNSHRLPGPSVFGQVQAAGRTAKVFAESEPGNCATGNAGNYAVRHTGWSYFSSERAECNAGQVNLSALPQAIGSGLPTASLVVPNLCNDAHNCSLATADNWLHTWLPKIEAGRDFTSGNLAVVVTFDEGESSDQTVLTAVLQAGLRAKVVGTPLTHYSLTGLIDDVARVPRLREAVRAPDMGRAFGLTS